MYQSNEKFPSVNKCTRKYVLTFVKSTARYIFPGKVTGEKFAISSSDRNQNFFPHVLQGCFQWISPVCFDNILLVSPMNSHKLHSCNGLIKATFVTLGVGL